MTKPVTLPLGCPDCGSTKMTWSPTPHKLTQVSDGRLRLSETTTLFALGCDECSETLLILDTDEVAQLLNGAFVASAQ